MAYVYRDPNVTSWRSQHADGRCLKPKLCIRPHPLVWASLSCSASRATSNEIKNTSLSGLMTVLKEDSPNLFTDQGMDLSIYAPDVDFQDPITDYSNVQVCSTLVDHATPAGSVPGQCFRCMGQSCSTQNATSKPKSVKLVLGIRQEPEISQGSI